MNQEQVQPGQPLEEELVTESATADEAVEAPAEQPVGEEIAALQEELAQVQAQVAELKDQALRAQAEAQNTKRRAAQDVEKAHKFALDKFANDLLPVVDSLERALESSAEQDAMREGIELTLKMMLDTLSRHGLAQINPVGEPFDPQYHEAMSMLENAEVEPNTVLAAFQKGYTLNGRLVRPAMVVVSKGGKPVADAQVDEKV